MWATDLSGNWFYRKGAVNKMSIPVMVGNAVDAISKNGVVMLNVALRGDGTLPENQAAYLTTFGDFLKINGEGIYRSRLPLGHFNLESKGDIIGADLRLDLWDAELTGTIKTSQGSYDVRGLTHSTADIIYFETEAHGGESIKITWHPDEPMPPVRATLDAGGGPKGGSWDRMRQAPMPMPPKPTWSSEGGMEFCLQPLYQNRVKRRLAGRSPATPTPNRS